GDFRGVPSRHHVVPGWSCSPGGGARLFPRRHGKQTLELIAAPNAPKIAVSDLRQIGPGVLEVKADVNGRGVAALGFEAFDASRRTVIQSGKQPWQLTNIDSRIKFNFPINAPGVAYVRITLTAEPGSFARFSDVEAEMHYGPAPAPAPAPVPVAPPPPQAQMLTHEGFYTLESLPPVSVFQASVAAGSDITFKLGEHRGQWWSVAPGYDPRICRIELKHKHKGRSYAKIELNGMYRGTTNVEFVHPTGRRVIVQFTSL
ncbi:MAG: hypothetical protein J6Y54_04240, partial [Lentisphaeria bacterium]|nr:hypothetical protein [Lentisphaeria bacterium]